MWKEGLICFCSYVSIFTCGFHELFIYHLCVRCCRARQICELNFIDSTVRHDRGSYNTNLNIVRVQNMRTEPAADV